MRKLHYNVCSLYGITFCICLFIIFIPIDVTLKLFNQFDDQRIYQLGLLFFSLTLLIIDAALRKKIVCFFLRLPLYSRLSLLALLILAVISSLLAPLKNYAFLELSLYLGLFILSLMTAVLIQINFIISQYIFLSVIFISVFSYQTAFFSGYIASFLENIPLVWPEPFIGFANIRFFNQYQLWLFFLIYLPLVSNIKLSLLFRSIIQLTAIGWASLLFFSGSRGAILAVFISLIITAIIFKKQAYSFIKLNGYYLLSGFLFFLILFKLLPTLSTTSSAADLGWRTIEQVTDNSPRLQLWTLAVKSVTAHPWFGIGLMHFAYYSSALALHPHNCILQWAAELGLPSLLILLILVARGLLAWIKQFYVMEKQQSAPHQRQLWIILFCTMTANLLYSLVDGVIVMPVSQVLMSVITGWMLGLYFHTDNTDNISNNIAIKNISALMLFAATLITLVYTVSPSLLQKLEQFSQDTVPIEIEPEMPRFWSNGKIP